MPEMPLGNPGGFGAVFRGESSQNEEVAVKRLHVTAESAAHRELDIAQELLGKDLDHVMPILDAGQDAQSNAYFLVMPIAEYSLDDYLRDSIHVPEAEAIRILDQIATGLQSVPNIVHRDLKPANILFHDGRWRIADFGIARFVEAVTSSQTLCDCLSPHFAAPEQWQFERAGPATDVYALGCIAHVLLTGKPPFEGSQSELRARHLSEPPPRVENAGPQTQTIMSMMLRKASSARPNITRVRSVFEQIARALSAPADPSLERLAGVGAAHEREKLEAEAERDRKTTIERERQKLANEAYSILEVIFDDLATRIANVVPNARIERSSTGISVHVGVATLEMDIGTRSVIHARAFPKSKWDVVCGAAIEVRQSQPAHRRSASLWYTRQDKPSADYRWYEVGYVSSVFDSRRFEFEPTALDVELADRAHWTAMDIVATAHNPVTIDDEDTEGFFRRWSYLLAIAGERGLPRQSSSLPIP